jgi:hypothetical protein
MTSRGVSEKKIGFVLGVFLAFVLSFSVSVPVYAQVSGAALSGTVTDSTHAAIPKADVTITAVATGVTRRVTTDSAGFYTTPNLLPGSYEVTVKAPGFSTEIRKGITLTVGAQQVLDIGMTVGQMTQAVQVTTEAPQVELASSAISAEVNSATVRELPLNGRSWTDLATLQPGVTSIETQPTFTVGADRGNRGFGSQIAVTGARPQMNNYRLDGLSMNGYANAGPGSVLGGQLGVDAVQEFSVLTTNYSSEYGRTAGGVINAITKSGTNQFHGTAYEFLRNSALDARNFFDLGNSPPPFKRNQFGASIGGPIVKGRTFFFADYEGIRQVKGHSVLATVPSPNARLGILAAGGTPQSPCPANSSLLDPAANICVDDSAAKYLAFYPVPQTSSGDKGTVNIVQNQNVTENFLTGRLDHKFSDKDSLFATVLWDKTPFSTVDGLNNVLLGNYSLDQTDVVEWTHVFKPTLVNTVRVGYNRQTAKVDYSVKAINSAAADLSLGANPGRYASQVAITGLALFTGGLDGNPTYYYRWNSFQGYDDAFFTHGTHSIKFGGGVERMQNNALGLSNPNGLFTFGSIQNFLTNHPNKFQSGLAETLRTRGYRQTLFGAYIQDDWRVLPNLTLNLGVRYETVTVEKELQNQLASLPEITAPHFVCGVDVQPFCSSIGPLFSNPTRRDFQPRVGFAWDPFRNGKTAVRGGFGVFDNLPLMYQFTGMEILTAPYFQIGSVNNKGLLAGTFYTGATSLLDSSTLRGALIEQKMPRNYVMQWNLNIQRQITPNVTALIGYVGAHGVHMPLRIDDVDIVMPTTTSAGAGYIWPNPIGSGEVINPNFGSMRGMFYAGDSVFHALEAAVTKRMSHGVQFQTSFTWGKTIDNSSGTGYADQFSNSMSSLTWFDKKLTRGVSDFNIGRTLVISTMWEVPEAKSLNAVLGRVVNGWQLGGIFKISDGVPFTPTFATGGDPLGLNSSDDYDYPDRLSGAGCNSLVNPRNPNHYVKTECFSVPAAPDMAYWTANCDQFPPGLQPDDPLAPPVQAPFPQCFNLRGNSGRNILTSPGLLNLDFSVFKNNYIRRISENFNIQFRAEFFNILNRANFAPPVLPDNTDLFGSDGALSDGGGVLTSTVTTSREIQFALKFIW